MVITHIGTYTYHRMTYQLKWTRLGKLKSSCGTSKIAIQRMKWNLVLSCVMHRDDQDFEKQITELNKKLVKVKVCGLKTMVVLVTPPLR